MKNVCVQGLGFVGLATAIAVADACDENNSYLYNVTGIDVPNDDGKRKAAHINNAEMPFLVEDETLINALRQSVLRGNLKAATDAAAFAHADVILVDINLDLVVTPSFNTVSWDNFKAAIKTVGENMPETALVVIETTVPPGACENVVYPILKDCFNKRGLDTSSIMLAHSYERVMPGSDYLNSIKNYWRVFAGLNKESAGKCREFLTSVINTRDFPLFELESMTASETAKVLENSYRAVNIALMEEWGRFAESAGVDLFKVIEAIHYRPTHSNMMYPGFGVGGYCLTKDPLFAEISARQFFRRDDLTLPFSAQAVKINNLMPMNALLMMENLLGEINNKKILVLGVSYKRDVGDTRYSATEIFVREAISRGAVVTCHDPYIDYWHEMNMQIESAYPDLTEYDGLLLAVKHTGYLKIDYCKWINKADIAIVDANNVLTEGQLADIKKITAKIKCVGRG